MVNSLVDLKIKPQKKITYFLMNFKDCLENEKKKNNKFK